MDKTVLRQLLDLVPQRSFRRLSCEQKVSFDKQGLSAWEQFICMSFAQLTHCTGLREIEISVSAMSHKTYHLGLHSSVSKSNLSRANNKRPSSVFKSLAELLIKQASNLYKGEKLEEELKQAVYILDSTYISLCLSLFPWAKIGKQHYAGIKVHTQLDLRGSIPTFIRVSKGTYPDNKMLDEIVIEPGAFYVMDKAYVDFARLSNIDDAKGYFVVRFKSNIKFKRLYSSYVTTPVMLDQIGKLTGSEGKRKYQNKIRKVIFHDCKKNKNLVFMTNNFSIKAELIPALYKHRWQIEIFFKWIKQNLRIKKFYGTSQNAIETQIWIAISTYLIVAIAKKKLKLDQPLSQILHILSISLFENEPIFQLLNKTAYPLDAHPISNQLNLFTFR